MKNINVKLSDYVEAPIDDKNVMSDSIIENLFDDKNYVWKKNVAMGFVGSIPTFAEYCGSKMKLCIPILYGGTNLVTLVNAWGKNVIERITGDTCEIDISWEDHGLKSFLIEDRRLIVSFLFNGDMRVFFNRNQKKQ